jgi:hypothetical protein
MAARWTGPRRWRFAPTRSVIAVHLGQIFADHPTPTYLPKVREVRALLAVEPPFWYLAADLPVVCPRTADALSPLRLDCHS